MVVKPQISRPTRRGEEDDIRRDIKLFFVIKS